MLPLAGPDFPSSLETFLSSLRGGLAGRGISVRDIRGDGEWPRLAELVVDLSGAKLSRATRPARADTEPQSGVSIARLAVTGSPLFFETTPLRFDLHGQDAECAFARDSSEQPMLLLARTRSGSLALEAQRADLEVALKTLAEELLAKQGATVKSAKLELLELLERGPRSLGFRAEITAKAFLVTTRVEVTGQLRSRRGSQSPGPRSRYGRRWKAYRASATRTNGCQTSAPA